MLIAVVAIVLLISISHTSQVNNAAKMVAHTQEVIISSEKVLSSAVANETASRGYAVTGREDFLAAMRESKADVHREFANLKLLTKDNSGQQAKIDSLSAYLDKRISFSDSTEIVYKKIGSAAALARIGMGKLYSDKVKSFIESVQKTENILLVQRKDISEKKLSEQNGILLSIIITILLLLGVFIQKVRLDLKQKRQMAEKLVLTNAGLEKKVQERTDELTRASRKLEDTFMRIDDAFIALDKDLNYTYLNKRAEEMIGYKAGTVLGKNVWEVFPDAVGSATYQAVSKAMKEQRYILAEDYYAPFDLWQENHIYPSQDGVSIFIRDISERREAEQKIFKANRLYFFISQVNQMIVRVKDEKNLFDETCRITVSLGGFKMAWIALFDKSTGKLDPVISSNNDGEYLQKIRQGIINNVTEGKGPSSKAIREAGYVICNDIANEPLMEHWKEEAMAHGYLSSMHFPLKTFNKVVGAVAFYAGEKNFFDESEILLLQEAVGDICFALENIEKEKIKQRAEEEMRRSNERFEILAMATNDAVWDWDLITNKVWRNKNFYTLFGYNTGEMTADVSSWMSIVHPDDKERVLTGINDVVHSGKEHWVSEYRCIAKDGTVISVFDRAFVLHDDNKKPNRMIGSMLNITALKQAQEDIIKEKNLSDSVINSLPGIFYLYDTAGKFLRWNKNFETVSGYTSEEIAVMHPLDFFDKDEKELLTEKIGNVFITGEDNVQASFLLKSGEKIPYYFTGIAVDYKNTKCLMGVGIDFSERVKAQEEVKESSEKLHQLTAHLQNIREEERKRIGREIHDELGQQLTAIKMDIMWIDKKMPGEFPELKDKLKNVTGLLNNSNQSVRRILNELRPAILEDYGLKEALDWLSTQFTDTTGVPVNFIAKEAMGHKQVPEQVTMCIFRIYQEALTNITRYAAAEKVTTILNVKDNKVEFRVEDNGRGFDTSTIQAKKSFGILGMKERVLSLRGNFELVTAPAKGTTIDISIPIDTNKTNAVVI
jgi:PAS domain S-box-containing protein